VVRDDLIIELESRIERAQTRYGDLTSTHEGLGVASEEWDELRDAVRSNDLDRVESECLDLAAVLLRLADTVRGSEVMRRRSQK
jgi:NTP pyrophosphatase (non-canonical NTP hydrolase)